MTKAKRRIAWAIAAGLIALGAVAVLVDQLGGWDNAQHDAHLLYIEYVPPLIWPRDTFSPEAWKQTPLGGHYRFAKSLLGNDQLKGRTPSEVDGLIGGMRADRLGCLDNVGANEKQCTYLLRKVGFENLWWVLVLQFKNGRVTEIRRTYAWIDPSPT